MHPYGVNARRDHEVRGNGRRSGPAERRLDRKITRAKASAALRRLWRALNDTSASLEERSW